MVEASDLPPRATLRQLGIARSTFYGWYQRYVAMGFDGLHDRKPWRRPRWNAIPETVQKQVLDVALWGRGVRWVRVDRTRRCGAGSTSADARAASPAVRPAP